MDIISSPLRETVGPTEHKIELSDLGNSTTAEGETNICKICKVPEQNIREDNMHSFKPKILSIGPYNYGSSRLEKMERVKLTCQVGILGSISENYYDRDEIQELQNQARSFYSENIAMEPKSFAQMLLLDGCFILTALTGMNHRLVEDMENLMQQNWSDILHDLLLVENQIPFFVLEEIHKIAAGEGETTESLKENIATRVEWVLYQYPKAIRISEICQNDFHHLVHLCHMFFRPSPNSVEHHHDQALINQWHRAMEYHEAGVKFRVKPSSTGCSLLDVTFSNGTMEIPHLYIDADTESIFSNLILFEQSEWPHAGKYINAYITFTSKLLSNIEDVELLVREGVIEIVGPPQEILNLFGRLNILATYPQHGAGYYLESTLQSVEAHYRLRAHNLSMMEIISGSPSRENVGPTEQNVVQNQRENVSPTEQNVVQNQIELSDLDNSTTAEGETNICKIFKVPEQNIRDDNKHSFKPKILSIGPYNYGSLRLEKMEWVKLICQDGILGFNSENYYDRDEIKGLQNKARSFYSENIAMKPKSFVQMLLLDGCFILATLIGMRHRPEYMEILMRQEALNRHDILHDLLLVENQIPFFVLEEIHKIAAGEGETTESLKENIATHVERVLQQYPKVIRISEICQNDFHHLVHLCHMFFRPSPNSVEHHHDQAVINQWHRAMEYHEAGVKFRVKDSSTRHSLLDVTFSKGTMEIPHLFIDAKTESIFSNLILFEQSGCPHAGKYINAYITFMSKLLSNNEDVELLVRKSIIKIVGRHIEILKLFSRLNILVVYPHHGEDYYLESTLQSVEAHYRWRPNWWMAWLKQNCLPNPFVALATLAAEGERSNSESFRIDVQDINICKIFKVPEQIIRDGNMIAFKPKAVSIGPYNYDESSHLSGMEWKRACKAGILGNRDGPDYYDMTMELQRQARSFYSENIAMEPESFAEMLLLDGCFIIVALTGLRHWSDKDRAAKRSDQTGENLNLQEVLNRNDILHDLLMVENQIPFLVLEKIHNIAEGEGETTESPKENIASRVEGLLRKYPKAIESSQIPWNNIHNLLNLCHMFFRPSSNSVEHHHDQAVENQWHRAIQYHKAGVKFRVKPSSSNSYSLLDVTFSNRTMEIPRLCIDANTELIFSNLILFEIQNDHAGNYINAYITFMSKLLSYAEDVELLVRERIIEKVGPHEEILNLFFRLNRLVDLADYPHHGAGNYLESTLQSVEAYYGWGPNWWMAWLKQNRLINPFVALATLAGIIVLLCTVTQTVFTVLQFFKPSK